jgi:MSHA biogenesis protein MshQ
MAMTFNGTDQYFTTVADLNTVLGGGTCSLSAWFSTTQVGDAIRWESPGITGVEHNGDGNDIYWGWLDNIGHINFATGDGTNLTSSGAVNDGTWHHIGMSRNTSTGAIALYVDGVAVSGTGDTDTKTTPFYSIGRIEDVGTVPATPEYFSGSLDDVRVYTRVLSAVEFETIRITRGLDCIVYGLQYRWMMDEGSEGSAATVASSIKDMAGNQHGTPVGSPTYAGSFLKTRRRTNG